MVCCGGTPRACKPEHLGALKYILPRWHALRHSSVTLKLSLQYSSALSGFDVTVRERVSVVGVTFQGARTTTGYQFGRLTEKKSGQSEYQWR